MSIYITMWNIKIARFGPGDRWLEVFAQGVPAHIGQPSEGYKTDPYADFLPPIVSPYDWESEDHPYRAVVIVAADDAQKDGQRYVNPLVVLSGDEYNAISFPDLLRIIQLKLHERGLMR